MSHLHRGSSGGNNRSCRPQFRQRSRSTGTPLSRSMAVSGLRMPSHFQHRILFTSGSATRLSFNGMVVLLGQALELLIHEDQRVASQCLCFSGRSPSQSSVRMTASGFGTVRLLLKNILKAYARRCDLEGVAIRESSGGNNRSWRLTARPLTTTTETKQRLGGKAGVQINCRLGLEVAVANPAP